jgi:hypothetical protein
MIKPSPKVALALKDDVLANLDIVKRYYGISSNTSALRRALAEHAKQIKQPEARATYSRRVH